MKKKILMFVLSICFIIPCIFLFSACDKGRVDDTQSGDAQIREIYALAVENGETMTYEEWLASIKGEKGATGDSIELRVNGGYIQWKATSDTTWQNLMSIDSLKGSKGNDGTTPTITISNDGYWVINGNKTNTKAQGENGTTPTIEINDGYWVINGEKTETKAVGQDGKEYTIGQDGYWYLNGVKTDYKAVGQDTTYSTYTITFDYGAAIDFFDNIQEIKTIKSTEWLTNMPIIKKEYKESFLGWFIENTNKQIENYDFIGGDVTLYAKFDKDSLGLAGLYQNGKFAKSWAEIKNENSDEITSTKISARSVEVGHDTGYSYSPISIFENYYGDLIIENGITNIGFCAFRYSKLNSIKLPDSVVILESEAFYNADLRHLNIPKNVTRIMEEALHGLGYLESLDYQAIAITDDNCEYITQSSYVLDGLGLINKNVNITIGKNVTRIPHGFFNLWYTNVVYNEWPTLNIYIENSSKLDEIGEYAFNRTLVTRLFYPGTEQQWNGINLAEQNADSYIVFFYSESQPTDEGNYWHYDTDGVTPLIWETE